MVGNIVEKRDYSTAQQKMQVYHENDFFYNSFGRNDFEELSEMQLKCGNAIDYIIKYIGKSGERICYSRNIPTEFYKELDNNDIVTNYVDFVEKFILFNRVVDYTNDIQLYQKQLKLHIGSSGRTWAIS